MATKIKGYDYKDGKLIKKSSARSVSDKIREKKSTKQKPVKRVI
jgi:hypothetical protein